MNSSAAAIAPRMQDIAAFRVMAILARARELEAQGRDIVHMEVGEPDFASPEPIIDAGRRALAEGRTRYTPAAGLPELRQAIADYYRRRFGEQVDPRRIVVTPGASGALQLVLGVSVGPGEEVLLTDPGYPCNRHMVSLFGGTPVSIPVTAGAGYAPGVDQVRDLVGTKTRALMVASPANPTGNVLGIETLRRLNAVLTSQAGALLICDEIYQGLQYDGAVETALALRADNVVVINSLSKFFGMTGWRVGWVVAPMAMIEPLERLAQNIFLAAPTPSQYAALAAFGERSMTLLEQRREIFRVRRDYLVGALRDLGFAVERVPAGAFYVYADASAFSTDSVRFTRDLLEQAGVAATPGADFGSFAAERYVRFAYTTDLQRLRDGVARIASFVAGFRPEPDL